MELNELNSSIRIIKKMYKKSNIDLETLDNFSMNHLIRLLSAEFGKLNLSCVSNMILMDSKVKKAYSDDCKVQKIYVTCSSDYFKNRKVITLKPGGTIIFGSWIKDAKLLNRIIWIAYVWYGFLEEREKKQYIPTI